MVYSEQIDQEIIDKYISGCSVNVLKSIYKTSSRKIRYLLKLKNISIRSGKFSLSKEIPCEVCEKTMLRKPHQIRQNKHHFCSKKCYESFHTKHWEQRCKNCGQSFVTTRKSKIYCSRECYKQDYNPKNFSDIFLKGYLQLTKSTERIKYDSSYELRRLMQYELDKNILHVERCKDKIKYFFDGRHRYYHPDFKLIYKDKIVVEEIKGYIGDLEIAKFNAARSFYKHLDIQYKVITVESLKKYDTVEPIIHLEESQNSIVSFADFVYTQMSIANILSAMSSCIRGKVACILMTKSSFTSITQTGGCFYLSQGVNYGACGSLDNKNCGCIHAEQVAIDEFKQSPLWDKYQFAEKVAFITLQPCLNCAKALVENNVTDVYYLNFYKDVSGIIYLKKNGVNCISYKQYLKNTIQSMAI